MAGRTKTRRRRDEVALSPKDDDKIENVALDDAMLGVKSQQLQVQVKEQHQTTQSHLQRAVKYLSKEGAVAGTDSGSSNSAIAEVAVQVHQG